MFKNYLAVAFRTLRRQKGYAAINILGLAVGLACSFFILLWVSHEVSVNRFHENGDRVHRVMRSTDSETWWTAPLPMAEMMETEIPEVRRVVPVGWTWDHLLTVGETSFREDAFSAGEAFFETFSYPLIAGDAATVLQTPSSLAISASAAERMFGRDWQEAGVLGQTIRVNDRKDFEVTGVFEDMPKTSTLQADVVFPMSDYVAENDWLNSWSNNGLQLFVELNDGATPEAVNAKIAGAITANTKTQEPETPFLQSLESMYLYGEYEGMTVVGGRYEYVRLFVIIAVFLLVIAAINFMNLATARSSQRAREIGVRKAIGAGRGAVAGQFLLEAMVIAGIAFAFALAFVALLLPSFSALTEIGLRFSEIHPGFLLAGIGITLVVGLLAGSYPALYLASFQPVAALKGALRPGRGTSRLRQGLVVFQFALSTLLIVGTLTVYTQMDYIRTKDLGLDRENVVLTRLEGNAAEQFASFSDQLRQRPGIVSVGAAQQSPLEIGSSTQDVSWPSKPADDNTNFYLLEINESFIETMGMTFASGRGFRSGSAADSSGLILNQRAVEVIGFEDPIGQEIEFWDESLPILGVVEDFHMGSMYAPIEPTVMRLAAPSRTQLLATRIAPGQTPEALAGIEATYAAFNPGYPFDYDFLDTEFEEAYQSEAVISTLTRVFAIVALFVAALGLFGLVSFTAEQRRKEVGVRKVLGATVPSLVALLTRDFMALVIVAFALALPLAYVLGTRWLEGFAYSAGLGAWPFVVAGGMLVGIALLTVGTQALRAAAADPIRSLRAD